MKSSKHMRFYLALYYSCFRPCQWRYAYNRYIICTKSTIMIILQEHEIDYTFVICLIGWSASRYLETRADMKHWGLVDVLIGICMKKDEKASTASKTWRKPPFDDGIFEVRCTHQKDVHLHEVATTDEGTRKLRNLIMNLEVIW